MAIRAMVVLIACVALSCTGQTSGDHGDGGAVMDLAVGSDGPTAADAGNSQAGAYCPSGPNTTSAGGAQVTLDIDVSKIQPISEYIYGINQYPENNYFLNYPKTHWGLMRWGGDSYSDWNWTNNDDNVGRDNGDTNTNQFMPFAYGNNASDPNYHGNPSDTNQGGAILDGVDSVPAAQSRGIASLVTVSLMDYVAANASNMMAANAPSADFVANKAAMASGGGQVYQDAFVQFMQQHYSAAPVFYSLDNEPNYWSGTHPEVFGTNDLSFDELISRNATFAAAIKSAAPSAKVFGPVVAGIDGFTSNDDYTNLSTNPYTSGGTDLIEYYLAGMKTQSTTANMRLLDVLDLHYYNDTKDKSGTAKSADECAQGPRDFWDSTYQTPDTTFDDYIMGWKPRQLIPRMQGKIAANYPGTLLSFSEYNNGCEDQAAGGVAEADTLGIFGQYGVYAATAWPLKDASVGKNWLIASFDAYRNYDGNGATVGGLSVGATSSDVTKASIYAFAHDGAPGLELVAINKTDSALTAEIRLSSACAVAAATPTQLTSAKAAMVSAGAAVTISGNALAYTLPAMSVTTLELR